jgi:hypothetical protein
MLAALRPQRPSTQLVGLAVIACALLMRVLVPQGWMPIQTAHGWQIAICTGTGPMQMEMPADMASAMKGMHHGSGDQDHNSNDRPCAFSGLAVALDEPPLLVIDLPKLPVGTWLAGTAAIVSVGRGLAAPPPPSTGPPAIL